jgi:hypothetical protein
VKQDQGGNIVKLLPLPTRETKFSQVYGVVAVALVVLIVAIWGATTFSAKSQQLVRAPAASIPIDVMRMMREAKDLPEERFEAH